MDICTETQSLSFSKNQLPIIGPILDYVETSMEFFTKHTFTEGEKLLLVPKMNNGTMSALFLATVTFILGILSVIKFEIVTLDGNPLSNDLHLVVMSKEDNIYVENIDLSRIMLWVENSDCLVMLISCIMIWKSSAVSSGVREYMFLPWLGATLRGLLSCQVPTACALVYTIAVANETLNPLFITAFIFLFMMEARMWMEIARLVYTRWSLRDDAVGNLINIQNEDMLQAIPDKPSFEVHNHIY